MAFDYIFFDLDGTLTDSCEGISKSVAYSLKELGYPPLDDATMQCFFGPPLIESYQKYCDMDEKQARAAISKFRERYTDVGIFENKVYGGAFETLEALKKAGKTLAVSTSKIETSTNRILDHFGLTPYFDFICGSTIDETRLTKADVLRCVIDTLKVTDLSRAVIIGDRYNDIEGAKAVGISSIGVLSGYGSREELEQAGADFICDDLISAGKICLS